MLKRLLAAVRQGWARVKALEPARAAEFTRALLVALVGVGWLTVDETWINSAVSAVGFVASLLLTKFVRSNVTPVAKLDGCAGVCEHDPATEG